MEIEIKSIHNFIQMILSNFLEKFALQKKKPKNLLKKIKKFDKIFLWQIQYLKFKIFYHSLFYFYFFQKYLNY